VRGIDTGPPDPGEEAGSRISNIRPPRVFLSKQKHNYPESATGTLGNQDCWLELYLRFLDDEINRLRGGLIARHYRNCAEAHYLEFKTSRLPNDRFKPWAAFIRICAGWPAQLRRGFE
jgi:hypothetical protein